MVSLFLGTYLLLLLVLNFSPLQQRLTRIAEQSLERQLGTELEIGSVEIGLFNRVTLKGVSVRDRQGMPLLDAGLLSAKIEFAPLLKGEVSLRTVSVLDADVNLYRKKKGEAANFQFVIDAFSSKKKKEDKQLFLRINSIILRRCNIAYHEYDVPRTPGCLNISHLDITDFGTNISLKQLTSDSLKLRIRSLQLKEASGLDVRSLSLRMEANREHCDISHFALDLPDTHLSKENLQADYSLDSHLGFLATLNVKGSLGGAQIATDDVAFLFPQLRGLHEVIVVDSDFNVRPKKVTFTNLQAEERNGRLRLKAHVGLNREAGVVTGLFANVQDFHVDQSTVQQVVENITGKDAPAVLGKIGNMEFHGDLHYKKDDWSTFAGKMAAGVGEVDTRLKWKGKKLSGTAMLDLQHLQLLAGTEKVPERAVLNVQGNLNFAKEGNPEILGEVGISSLEYRGVTYDDFKLHGGLKDHRLQLSLLSNNAEAQFQLNFGAHRRGRQWDNLNLEGEIYNLNLGALHLTEYFGKDAIASRLKLQLRDLNWKSPEGRLLVNDFCLSGSQPYHLRVLDLSAQPSVRGTLLKLNSDFGSVTLDGPLSLQSFKKMMSNLLGHRLPGMLDIHEEADAYKWLFDVQLSQNDFYSRVLHLPVALGHGIDAEGYLSSGGDRIFLSAVADYLRINSTELRNVRALLRDENQELFSLVQADKRIGKRNFHVELENVTQNGRLLTDLIWSETGKAYYNGVLKTETTFLAEGPEHPRSICTKILPTHLTVNDTLWQVLPGEVRMQKDSIAIKHIEVQREDQGLKLFGRLSKNPQDSLIADLNNIDVEYILSMFNLGSFSFSGLASGRIAVANTFDSLQVSARLDIPDFLFNHGALGHAKISGSWGIKDKRLNIAGDITEDGWGYTKVRGYVDLGRKGLDLHIDSKNTNVYFLNRYVGDIFHQLSGRTSGYCRVFGPFKAIDFEGLETADLQGEIAATGVRYQLSGGQVAIAPGKFVFDRFSIADGEAGSGTFRGILQHDHLKNIRYQMEATTSALLVYDKPETEDMPFYATAYGTGKVSIKGRPGLMEADVEMRPEKKTQFVYTVDAPESMGDIQLLRFADEADTTVVHKERAERAEKKVQNTSSTDIRLNFLVNVNPEATLKVMMDRRTGDHLLVHGYGPIRASFYNKGDFEMFGKLNVDRGVYKMSIQDVIRKDFEFTRGSYINFSGDPFLGDLGLRAVYTVNSASLSDLNIGNNLSSNSVRVNCVLNFSGKVKAPQVSFDLELPTVSEDVQQMVRNLISTEEDMNMQILYLLGVGRFYTYNYSSTETAANQAQSSVAMKSFLSNTLSSQLNNIISNAMGVSNWTFGANLSTGAVGWSDMEVEGILSGRLLNNRLLINGNFGYRDRPAYSSTTNFVGDFDVRYLLTPGGGISLKAYSETNDRYFSKSSLTTQGIGIQLKRDFSNLKELFQFRRKRGARKAKKEEQP